jgi:hypothetical protein
MHQFMQDGPGSGFPGGSIPDLEKPPDVIEGAGGGAAMPGGGGLSADDKSAYGEAADNANYYAAGTAGVAVVSGAVSSGGGLLVFGLMSAGFWFLSQVFSDLAEDPPQPHEHIVTFQRRVCRPPAMNDPVLSPVGIAIQRAVFSMVTGRGLLQAVERLSSAQQAGDVDWAVTHYGVGAASYQALNVDVATLAAALHAAGNTMSASPLDGPLKPAASGVRQWIESPGMESKMTKALRDAGYVDAEIKSVIAWWKTDPRHAGAEQKCSELLLGSATKLYASAQRLSV